MTHPKIAILVGSISGGFGIQQVVENAAQAEDIVIAQLAEGKMAEAIVVQKPSTLGQREIDHAEGDQFIVFGSGVGNSSSMFGPFPDDHSAEEFGERHRADGEEWQLFVDPAKMGEAQTQAPKRAKDSSTTSSGYTDFETRLKKALPAEAGYEKGFRDGLESFALALGNRIEPAVLQQALTTTLDAYGNNVDDEALLITIDLNIFDDKGVVVDATTSDLSIEQLSDIVDHASQAILMRRDGLDVENILDELDEALSAADVISPVAGIENIEHAGSQAKPN